MPWIRPRVTQQPLVVDREIALERVGRRRRRRSPRTRAPRASPRRRRPSGRSRSSDSGAAPHDSSSALAASAMSRRESTSVPSRSKTMRSNSDCGGSRARLRLSRAVFGERRRRLPDRHADDRQPLLVRVVENQLARSARRSDCCRARYTGSPSCCSGSTSGSSWRSIIL